MRGKSLPTRGTGGTDNGQGAGSGAGTGPGSGTTSGAGTGTGNGGSGTGPRLIDLGHVGYEVRRGPLVLASAVPGELSGDRGGLWTVYRSDPSCRRPLPALRVISEDSALNALREAYPDLAAA